ncbi:unnamed protein product [Lampetra planeri]
MGPAQAVSPFNAHARSCSGSVCSANGESRCCPLSEQGGCVDDSGCPAGSECHGVIDDTKGQCVSSAVPILAEVL